jgi:Tol biopolymer transport system component
MNRVSWILLAALAWAGGTCVGVARADVFEPISLASASAIPGSPFNQQAESANDAAISGDGRYVAFDGAYGGHRGVFRRDLQTGAVATVAEGDAVFPSISEDGRYISFTTTARLDPVDDANAAPDVYVRDMSDPSVAPCEEGEAVQPCAFTLASAVNGGRQGLSYEYGENRAFEETHYGSVASGRSAISADGRSVAFETTAQSNLANPARENSRTLEPPQTPAGEVAVRDLDSEATILVSARYDPATGTTKSNGAGQVEPTPASAESGLGAVFPSGSAAAVTPAFPSGTTGASISADGSTVAWLGQQIAEQAPVMASDLATSEGYTEPLWRRIDEGQQVPTRRITGGSDPQSAACNNSGEVQVTGPATLSDPCQGPFDPLPATGGTETGIWTGGTAEDYLPRLSADGMTVAFLSNAREIASGEELKAAQSSSDLYVVDMQSGLTRVAALRRLTELAGGSAVNVARTAPIVDLGISPDGSEIAFSTERTIFPLGSPAFVSAPAAVVGAVELFDIDLSSDTLTRVTQGYEGEASEVTPRAASATTSPSFSSDGDLLAFSSNSDNLVYGDGNKAGDAFVVRRKRFASNPPLQEISAQPALATLAPRWILQATVRSKRDGSVLVEVTVPGAGTANAGARAAVRLRSVSVTKQRGHHGRRASRKHTRTTVATRTVAAKLARPRAAGLVDLTLGLGRRYAALAGRRGGLSATIQLSFSAAGHRMLRLNLPATFLRTSRPYRRIPKSKRHGRAKGAVRR